MLVISSITCQNNSHTALHIIMLNITLGNWKK